MGDAAVEMTTITYEAAVGTEPSHPACHWLRDFWRAKGGTAGLGAGAALPAYADIDFLEIPERLPCLFVAVPVDGHADYLVRFSGTSIEARLGLTIQGRRIRDIYPPEMADDFCRFYRRVAADGDHVVLNGRFIGLDIDHLHYEAILLPIAGLDGEGWVLGGLFAFDLD